MTTYLDIDGDLLQSDVVAIFTEWHRRYTDAPDHYDADWAALPDATYGERAAAYFRTLKEEMGL